MLTHLRVRNVRQAYAEGVRLIGLQGVPEDSRNGPVLVMPGPLVTSYERPWERVLLDADRDANPFFHLMEAFWMLAGRNDVKSIMHFNSGMAKYSDDGETFHGAYGHRWRHHFQERKGPFGTVGMDQLVSIINLLRANPNDRRIVLQMWDPAADLGQDGLDFPCNTEIMFRVRDVTYREPPVTDGNSAEWERRIAEGDTRVLDTSLFCRSNDMYWGGYGANAVHFSVLHEFVASMLGVRMGELHQWSNNAHLYKATMPTQMPAIPVFEDKMIHRWQYDHRPVPLFGDLSAHHPDDVLGEIEQLWDDDPDGECELLPATTLQLVGGMRRMWSGWKSKDWDTVISGNQMTEKSGHLDWSTAAGEWMLRRRDKFK